MNKKITVIQLLNKIANGEKVPQEIKINSRIFNFCDTCKIYEDEYERDLVIKWDELNQEVEILEDNTEEIEELSYEWTTNEIADRVDKLIKAVNEIRKDLNK